MISHVQVVKFIFFPRRLIFHLLWILITLYVDAYGPSVVLFQFGSQSISLNGSLYQVEFVICHWLPCTRFSQ